ncbi:MAG: phospho-N-acetylmuramoyl-pentapeptide-transferase [Parcubacteria group bacterium]|nr:phospho-N-acetylmuramoyl-pentapeptide-transferase [Parcubacteria group bacterium]
MINETVRILALSMLSFVVALGVTPVVLNFLKRRNFNKQIRTSEAAPVYSRLHQKKAGTPTMGGIIIWGVTLGLAFLFWILDIFFDGVFSYLNFVDRAQTYLPIAAMLIAAMLGLFDDVLGVLRIGPKGGGLQVRHKFILYILLALLGAWWFFSLGFTVLFVPFFGFFDIGWWYIVFFIFIIVASAFSANETDGLDGLLGGVSLFAFGALTAVAFVIGRYDLAAFGGVTMGSLLAFLWFNIYPARFFMGDTGSMSLGITIGVISMLTNTALFLPFFASIMVLETISVMVQISARKLSGKKVFRSTPIHHHFEALGWPESQITMRFWIISAVMSGMGLVVYFISRLL